MTIRGSKHAPLALSGPLHPERLILRNRAELIRTLKREGLVIRVVRHWQEHLANTTRTVQKAQTNGYFFYANNRDGKRVRMWADIPKASSILFGADGEVVFHPGEDKHWTVTFEIPEHTHATRAEERICEAEQEERANAVPALYEMEPIGVNGALEAVAVLWFCSEKCRNTYETDQTVEAGMDAEYLDGTCCEECGLPVVNYTSSGSDQSKTRTPDLTAEERFPFSDWQDDVANGDTKLGYAEWVQHNLEAEAYSPKPNAYDLEGFDRYGLTLREKEQLEHIAAFDLDAKS